MSATEESTQKFVSTNPYSSTTHYHTDESCRYLQETRNYRERSDRYIEWHELDECPYCAGEKE